jgi:hypothetical protein
MPENGAEFLRCFLLALADLPVIDDHVVFVGDGEKLVESNPLLDARSFEREREMRKHIGDYTLFLAGMFPEYVATLPHRGLRVDSMIDYVKAGKESYRIVAAFDQFECWHVAALFRRLAEQFERCVYGLNRVKRDLDALCDQRYQALRRNLLGS